MKLYTREEVEQIALDAASYAALEASRSESTCEGYVDYFEPELRRLLDRAEDIAKLERAG